MVPTERQVVPLRKFPHRRPAAFGLLGAAAALAMVLSALTPGISLASSHREAPLLLNDPLVDATDVWAFRSPDQPDHTTLIASWLPFEEPAGGPNFYKFAPGVNYDIKIDRDGDGKEDITYRWVFTDHYRSKGTFLYNTGPVTSLRDDNLNFYQTYDLRRITPYANTLMVKDAIAVPSYVGKPSMPDYEKLFRAGTYRYNSGQSHTWAGQSDDAFFLDLRIFDLLYGGDFSEVGDDTLHGFNVQTIGLQVPSSSLAWNHDLKNNPIIGVWSTVSRRSTEITTPKGNQSSSGDWVQVSRLGSPLVNEVVIPVGKKDLFNASYPRNDAQFLPYVQDPIVPHVVKAVYGLPVPDSDPTTRGIQRSDLISVFLTGVEGLNQPKHVNPSEMLRLNMLTPVCERGSCPQYSRLGVIGGDVAGYPNGRRLADDVVDISLQVVEGELLGSPNDLGDGVNTNDKSFLKHFPYVAVPWSGSDPNPHG
jgi:Domain of unknown function (DUF4331)